jgi:PAS domain S-box-containing protein
MPPPPAPPDAIPEPDLCSDADGAVMAADDRAAAPLPSRDRDTEQRLAELEAVYDAAPVGLCILDSDLRFVRLNRRFAEINGVPVEEHIGRTPREVVPDLGEQTEAAMRHVLETGEMVELEVSGTTPARPGIVRYWNERWEPMRDGAGEITGISISAEEVTERKAAEAALRASEERFRTAFETTPLGMALRGDLDGRVTASNSALEEMLGYSKDELRGMPFSEFTHPDDAQGEWELARSVLSGETDRYELEKRYIRKDGRIIWVRLVGTLTRDRDGSLLAGIAIIEDITERKRAEAELQRSETLYRSIAQNFPKGAIYVFDRDMRFLIVEGQGLEPIGWSKTALEGTTVQELDKETAEILEPRYRRVLAGETQAYETTYRGRTMLSRYVPLRDGRGNVELGMVVSQDITERKQAEEMLKESEAKYRNLVELSPDAILIHQDGLIVFANPTAAALVGAGRPEALVGRPALDIVHPDMRELAAANIERDLRGEDSPITAIDLLRDDGTTVPVQGRGALIPFNGRPAVQVVLRDVTEEVRAAEALRTYAENLRRSNEDLERFAYVSSHDLQEPLRSIVSFSQLLERRYKGRLGTDADEYIEFIVEGGTRMQALIQDLLAYSRVNTTRQELARTDTADVLAAVERHLDVQLREVGAVITHGPMPVVMADPLQLEQVFANLVANAIKFRKPDVPLRVHVGARRLDGFWEFSVADNGIGIEPEYFEKIFVIFQRLHTKDAYPGTGIGLAIVKRIIDRHGGTIRVESTPGGGSTFFFTLPAA